MGTQAIKIKVKLPPNTIAANTGATINSSTGATFQLYRLQTKLNDDWVKVKV